MEKTLIKNLDLFEKLEPDKFYTYLHFTMDSNEIFYVGKGTRKRCILDYDRSDWWRKIVNKHGFYVIIDKINLSNEEAFDREKELIKIYGRRQFGGKLVNLTDGGDGGPIGFGKDNPNYGNRGSKNPLSKAVVKLSLKGEFLGEWGSVIEAALFNNELPQGISGVCRGARHQLKGFIYVFKKDYEEGNYSLKLGPTNKIPILLIDKDSLKVINEFPSINSTKSFGFIPAKVGLVCLGKRKSHGGYIWKYKNTEQ